MKYSFRMNSLFRRLILTIGLFIYSWGLYAQDSTKIWNEIPSPLGWVSDFEGDFTLSEIQSLEGIIKDFEKRTSIEIAVITIPKGAVSKGDFEKLSLKIARAWKVGKKKKNNGILIAVSKGHRMIRIQNGSGVQDELSDSETKRIIDDVIIPRFKQDQYYLGVFEGILEIVKNI